MINSSVETEGEQDGKLCIVHASMEVFCSFACKEKQGLTNSCSILVSLFFYLAS